MGMGAEEEGSKRNTFGPRPVGALVSPLTRPAFRRRSAAASQILADWEAIVGPALAGVTAPRRLSGTTLTLACSGPIAMELQHMAGELAARINGHLGRPAVERLRFVQEALAPPLPVAPVRPATVGEIPDGFPPGPLGEALARLGAALRGS